MDVAVMVEGQDGLTWPRWTRLAGAVEDLGFDGLFRSDHFTNPEGPVKPTLDLWTSLTWLADNTDDLEFGPLVTPFSMRHPAHTARMARDVHDLADGRLILGVGAGWQAREHEAYDFPLLDVPDRFDRFEEGVEVVASLLRSDGPVSVDGDHYDLEGAELLPHPDDPPRLLVGGNGPNRTLPTAAAVADEWNGVFLDPDTYRERSDRLDDLLVDVGREPGDVRRSLMTQVVFGRDEDELEAVLDGRDPDTLRERGAVVGTPDAVADHLDRLDEAGADCVMLQWLDLEDLERLGALAESVT